jgi:nucleoside-diphosphate-sugar epimerase
MMSSRPSIVVVGADGFVGSEFAECLQAQRVVYGPCRQGEVHITRAEELLRKADVVINAGGFRVRRGLTLDDYRRCHQQAIAAFVPWIREGSLFLHMSSAHVLGKSKNQKLGNHTPPNPTTYPSAAYAIAKLEADEFLRNQAESAFRLIYLRPTILWARPGDTSLIDNLAQLAKRGIMPRLYPRDARHHLCNLKILVDVARQVIERRDVPHLSTLVVADPYTITSRQLEALISQYTRHKTVPFPVPAQLMSTLLQHSFSSKNPKLDLKTWGDIFGVLHLDTVYDPFETFGLLGIDPSRYSLETTLKPFLQAAFGSRLNNIGEERDSVSWRLT